MIRRSMRCFFVVVALLAAGAAVDGGMLHAQSGTIRGEVMGPSGQPVGGAQVFLSDSDRGTLTDDDGKFLLLNVPAGTHVVEVRHISYSSETETVSVEEGGSATVRFELSSNVIALDEVVVTGVGVVTERKRLGQSVESLGAEEFETAPVTNVSEVLSGRIPGLVANSLGETGQGAPIRLRGTVSLSQSNDPVIYIDGVRVDNERDEFASIVTSRLNDLNPANIERIEVLKGAAAATLYGTEASSGVIQIFTKRGRVGEPQWSASTTQQFFRLPEGRIPANAVYDTASDELLRNFPAEDYLRTGHHQSYSLSVRGGGQSVRYYASGSYKDEQGTLPTNALSNGGLRFGLDFDHSDKLQSKLNVSLIRNTIRAPYPTWGLMGEFTIADPRIAGDRRPYGELFYTVDGALAYSNTQRVDRHTVSAEAAYQWTPDLRSQVTVGYHGASELSTIFIEYGEGLRDPQGRRDRTHKRHSNITLDFGTSWDAEIADGLTSTLTVGGQSFWESKNVDRSGVTDYPGPGLRTLRGGATVYVVDEFYEEVINAGLFAQEQIGINDRLFVTAGLRVDGNSAFGEDFGFQPYPKLGSSWTVSDESFWPFETLNLFRLRGAYGTSGLQPGAYDALRTWRAVARVANEPALQPQSVGNPNLEPERSTEQEIGADLGFFEGRLGLELTYFRQRTTNGILERRLPPSQGFLAPQFVNIGKLESQGLEALLEFQVIESSEVNWRLSTSFSSLDQTVVDLGDVAPFKVSSDTRRWNWIMEGYSPGAVVAPVLDPNDAYDLSVPVDQFTSLDQVIPNTLKRANGQDSLVFIGHQQPTLTGTIGTTLELPGQNLQFRMLWKGESGFVMFNQTGLIRTQIGLTETAARMNQELKDPGTSPERRREIAERYAGMHPQVHSTWVEDGSYLRLQEASMTWQVPETVGDALGLGATSLTLSGRNLMLITGYDGLIDPGTSSSSGNDFAQNVDYFGAPTPPRIGLTLQTAF